MYDKVPVVIAGAAAAAAPILPTIPGPTETEWKSAIVGILVLAVREFVWWLRNRKG